jgi:hypothetical protein
MFQENVYGWLARLPQCVAEARDLTGVVTCPIEQLEKLARLFTKIRHNVVTKLAS